MKLQISFRRALAMLLAVLGGLAMQARAVSTASPPKPVAFQARLALGRARIVAARGGALHSHGPRAASDPLLSENFEGQFPEENGWSLFDPTIPYVWSDETFMPHGGSSSGWCAGGAEEGAPDLDPARDDYPDNLASWMIWGPVSLNGTTNTHLVFWYSNQSEPNFDFLGWVASIDGLQFYGLEVSGNSGGWQRIDFALDNVPGLGDLNGRPEVWIAFRFRSDASVGAKGAFLDDIVLSGDTGRPPSISHTPVLTGTLGIPIPISATITDDGPQVSGNVHYRQGGEETFQETALAGVGSTFSGSIPGTSVTARGVEYFISASDGQSTTFEPAAAAEDPVRVRVAVPSLASPAPQPSGSAQNAYRMLSIPLETAASGADAILGDDLGAYDDKQWRLFRYDAAQYWEYPDSRAATLAPGKGYWLIVRDAGRRLDAGPGTSTATSDSFTITLEPGWNDIGLPWDFPVEWSEVRVARSSVDGPYSYTGTWLPPAQVTRLEPWQGYAVRNLGNAPLAIVIPPRAAAPLSKQAAIVNPPDLRWQGRFEARCDEARDAWNLAGWADAATAGKDAFDYSEPPPVGEYVSLYFPFEDVLGRADRTTNDIRSGAGSGAEWRMVVETNVRSGAPVILSWEGFGGLSPDLDAVLLQPAEGVAVDPRREDHHSFGVAERLDLLLVVGTRAFVEEHARIAMTPRQYTLAQNYPNPFNPETEIRYQLPLGGRVTLRVFDALGQRVRTLVDAPRPAGVHRVFWDGRDGDGRALPSGIYFYRIESPRFRAARKMTLLR